MAKKSNIEVTNVWQDRILRSEKIRERRMKRAKVLVDFYCNRQWGDRAITIKDKSTCNLIFPHIKTQLPYLYFQNPKFIVRATKREYTKSAEAAEPLLNYYANETIGLSLKRHIRAAILDAFFIFGCVKVGYNEDIETNPKYGEPLIKGYDGDKPIYDIDEKGIVQYDMAEEIVTAQKYFARRVSPASLLFDIEADNFFEEGRYIIQEIIRPFEDVKNDSKYDKKVTNTLEATYTIKPGATLSDKDRDNLRYTEVDKDLKRIKLYEIYDLESNKLKVVAEGCDQFLRNEEMPDGIDGHPFTFLYFNEIPDEIYPLSDLESLKSIQEDYNIAKTMISAHAKRYGRKYGYVKSYFGSEEDIDRIEEGQDGIMFEVKELPLQGKVIEPLEDAPLDPSVYQWLVMSKEDFRESGGSSEMERGVVERRKTAYEASKISEGLGVRKEDRRTLVEDFVGQVGTKILKSMQANLTPTEVERFTGPNKKSEWVTLTKDQILGDLTVKVEVGSTTPKIPETERQEILQYMQIFMQMPPQMMQVAEIYVNFEEMFKALTKTFNTFDESLIINDSDTQEQIKQKQFAEKNMQMAMQMEQMRAGVAAKQKPPGEGTGNAPV